MREWKLDAGDVRNDPRIADEMLEFMARHGVLCVAMIDRIIGCPHQEGIDYHGQWSRSASSGRDATASRVNACIEPLLTCICVLSLQRLWAMNSLRGGRASWV
jgi:hypothetical protein